tara:strand:+ start:722 stop:1006 length:285 start_codon:yes stop_codon:yes gene_type:complete
MIYDHEAIRKAYPNVKSIIDNVGVFDKDKKEVTLDQAKVDAARVELAKLDYKWKRANEYPDWELQLDYIFHNGLEKWKTDIVQPVKDKFPKGGS